MEILIIPAIFALVLFILLIRRAWLFWKMLDEHAKFSKYLREEQQKRFYRELLYQKKKEGIIAEPSSVRSEDKKSILAVSSDPPRLEPVSSTEPSDSPEAQYNDAGEYISEMDTIFAGWPWSEAWPDCQNDELYCQYRIKRAHEQDLIVLSYCPKDQSARIKGTSGKIYAVSPYECDCDDFVYSGKKRQRPCKHIYKLALTLFHGFDDDTDVCDEHTVLSDFETEQQLIQAKKEQEKERRRSALKRRSSHRRIITFLKKSGPVTRRDIVDRFSSLDEKEVQRAVKELYSVGLIQGEKRRGRYYHWVDDDSTV